MSEWTSVLKAVEINSEQKKKILKGRADSYSGKIRLLNIFGKIPDTIWDVRHTEKLDIGERSQQKVAQEHRNDTLKAFDNSTRNQNVRWKGAISMFPRNILEQLLDFYTEKGDVFLDPFCVSGDTLISLPEGDFPIKDLVGKEPYVYCSDGKEIKLRKAWNIRKTKKNAPVLKITLDDGNSLIITPNHKVMLLNGSWIKAEELKENDSLMPFYRKKHKQSGRWTIRKKPGVWIRQSRFIMNELLNSSLKPYQVVHHIDENIENDSVENLCLKSNSAHSRLHHPKGKIPYIMSKKTKRKISKINTGSGNPFFGKRHNSLTKKIIGVFATGRNKGKTHTKRTKELMKKNRFLDIAKINMVKKLLKTDVYTYQEIANIVGIHKNTVGNISRNKFNYNHKIINIEYLREKIDVYNMEVDEFHNFVANGVVVHNCGHNSRMEPAFKKDRHYIGWDCSKEFMKFNKEVATKLTKEHPSGPHIELRLGDSRKIDNSDNCADFIFSSPPYWNIEFYGDEPEQLGKLSYEEFMKGMQEVYAQCFRVLKPGKFCIMNVNDFRKGGEYYSYHVDTVNALKNVGFKQYDMVVMRYANAMRKSFPNQIWEEKLMPKSIEYILIFFKPPNYPHSAVYPFKAKTK